LAQKFRSRLEIWTGTGRLGILADAFDVRVREVVNGEYYVQFLYPRQPDDEERYAALVEDNEVRFPQDVERGQIFRIKRVEEVRDGLKIYKLVEAHHIAFTLGQYFHDDYIDFAAGKTLQEMLAILGADTPFTFAIEGNFSPQDIFDWGEKSKLELLHELRELYGAELVFDNYEITLATRKGGNYGARVRYRHNMKGIKRTSHSMERITRLYGYGKNGLTIEGYQGHTVKYIDSEYFDPTNPYMGKMEWPDIEDQGRLLQEMQKYLKKYELPQVTYDVDFVQMEKVDPEFESERIREAGDTVTCFDEVLGYSFDARAMEFERYPFEPKRGRVSLANVRELKTADYIFQATVGSKKAITYTTKNAVLKGVKYDDSLTLVDGMGMKVTDPQNVERVRIGQIGPGRYGLRVDSGYIEITGKLPDSQIASAANWNGKTTLLLPNGIYTGTVRATQIIVGEAGEKIGDNLIDSAANWNGKTTLLTPSGIYTGTIQANQINAATLSAISANLGTVTAGHIQGLTITGGTIIGSLIQGATIQTSPTPPNIVLSGNELRAYSDASTYMSYSPNAGISGPGIRWYSMSSLKMYFGFVGDGTLLQSQGKLYLTGYDGIQLQTNGNVMVWGWNQIYDYVTGQTLQQVLNSIQNSIASLWSAVTNLQNNKADKGAITAPAGPYNGGIPIGTNLMTAGGGVVTWNGIPAHSHTQQ